MHDRLQTCCLRITFSILSAAFFPDHPIKTHVRTGRARSGRYCSCAHVPAASRGLRFRLLRREQPHGKTLGRGRKRAAQGIPGSSWAGPARRRERAVRRTCGAGACLRAPAGLWAGLRGLATGAGPKPSSRGLAYPSPGTSLRRSPRAWSCPAKLPPPGPAPSPSN